MVGKRFLTAGLLVAWVLAAGAGGVCAESESGWRTSLAFGGTMTSGNSDTLNTHAALRTERKSDRHEVRAGMEGTYGESEVELDDGTETTETTAETAQGSLNYKRLWNRRYAYTDNSVLYDAVADIDYRLTAGVGGGYRVVDTERAQVGLELGGAYIREELADATTDDKFSLRAAARHDQQLSETAKLWESVEYLPNVDDEADYLLNAEAGVEAALNAKLSLRCVVENRYDNIPSGDRERNDVSVVASVLVNL